MVYDSVIADSPQDQPSRNKLIVFADGTYIELFNWFDKPKEPNAWANKAPGLIDFALTSMPPSTAESLHQEIAAQLQTKDEGGSVDLRYEEPKAGGRARKDGVQVKWKLTRPIPSSGDPSTDSRVSASGYRQDVPFFTHDVTEREVRIPFDDNAKTTHPCGALGISTVEVLYPRAQYHDYIKVYRSLLGVPATAAIDGTSDGLRHQFELESPVQGPFSSRILIRAENDESDVKWRHERGIGLRGLRLAIQKREGHGVRSLGSDELASTVFLEWRFRRWGHFALQ